MKCGIVGAGGVGTACALALLANKSESVTLISRSTIHRAGSAPAFSAFPREPIPIPERLHLDTMRAMLDGRSAMVPDSLFVCTPSASLLPVVDPPEGKSASPSPSASECIQRWGASLTDSASAAAPRFIATFTRGLTADGATPTALVQQALGEEVSARCALVSVAGPIYPNEWAAQSSVALTHAHSGSSAAPSPSPPSGIPPRPASALADEKPDTAAAPAALLSSTALSFDVRARDRGLREAVQQCLASAFQRESVSFVSEEDAGVLDILNACIPICAFGAGLVSNSYASASMSSSAAYMQHALCATEEVINTVLSRPAGTPLPPHLWATLYSASTNYASREFILGRRYDYHFKQNDALQAVYPTRQHQQGFDANMDGLYAVLKAANASSPFYEALIDTYSTFLRASSVGKGLVKMGVYDFGDNQPCALLQHAVQVDEAMLSGDEERFEAAKRRMTEAFSMDPREQHLN